LFSEYSNSEDVSDTLEDFNALESQSAPVEFVKTLILKSVEGKPRDSQINRKLLKSFIGVLSSQDIIDGILETTEVVEDLCLDAPLLHVIWV